MIRRIVASLFLVVLCASGAAAQQTVRGQFILPGGDLPSEPVRFYLQSDDGRINEYRFSDSNGRFILERLSTQVGYVILVDSDGSTYDTTRYEFRPAYQAVIRVILNPLVRKAPSRTGGTVSAASTYKPTAEAAKAYDAAMQEVKKQQFDAAERHLRRAVELDPKYFNALNDLGAVLMQLRRYGEAEPWLRQALAVDAKSAVGQLNLGITLNHLNRHIEAIPPLREALRLEPSWAASHLHLGVALVETDQFEEAERALLLAAKSTGPEEVAAHLYLGKLYARTGDFPKGIAELETYLQKAPSAMNADEVRSLIARMKREPRARR